MTPGPEQVDVHHLVAAGVIREEMHAKIPVEQQHHERGGQDRECGDDQQARGQRGPAEHRHAKIGHARGAQFEDRGDEIDAAEQGADARDLQRPEVVVDADIGREGELGQRRIGHPAGAREIADDERGVDQERSRGRQPETDGVQHRKCDVAHAELQRDDKIHQPDDERHRHEKDHDRAVRREDLVIVIGRQVALRLADRDRLLRAHHDRVRKAAQQHDEAEQHVHDADALVIDAGQPLAPQIRQPPLDRDDRQHGEDRDHDDRHADQRQRFVERDRRPAQPAQHLNLLPAVPADTRPRRQRRCRNPPPSR